MRKPVVEYEKPRTVQFTGESLAALLALAPLPVAAILIGWLLIACKMHLFGVASLGHAEAIAYDYLLGGFIGWPLLWIMLACGIKTVPRPKIGDIITQLVFHFVSMLFGGEIWHMLTSIQ